MDDLRTPQKKILSTYEAIMFRDDVINKWYRQSDVWAFKHGDDILASITALGAVGITRMFRRELRLFAYARLTCYMPVVGIGSLTSFMIQNIWISSQIVKSNTCPLCTSTNAVIAQVAMGVGYPLLAGSTVCFYMADKLMTYPVPPLIKAPGEVFQLAKKIVLKNPRPYLIIGAIHIIANSFITYQKQQTLLKLDLETRII